MYQRDELKPKTQIDDSNSIFQMEMWTFFEQRFQNIASNYINQAICKICEQQLHDITLSKLIGHSMTCGQEDNQFQKLNTIDQKVQQNEINDNGLKSITLTKTIESIKKLEVQNQIITSNYNEINNQELLNSKILQRNELLQNIKTTLGPDKLKDFQRIKELVEQKSFFKKPSKHLSKLMKEMGLNQRFLQLRQLQYECFLEVRRKQIVSKQKECRDKMKQNYMYFCQEMLAHYAAIEKHFLISKELSSQSAPQTLDPAANAIFQCPDIDF